MTRIVESNLVLASASPRRAELLSRLGIGFEVRPVDIEEERGPSLNPEIVVRRLARAKAEVARLLVPGTPILAADTVVVHDGEVLGKPANDQQAWEMLRRLRGQTHQVISAVAVVPAGQRSPLVRHPTTSVKMRQYTDEEIAASIERGHPFDKAGGYAIQDEVFAPVDSYDGCYCNVVGLPLWTTIELLRKAGVGLAPIQPEQLLPQCALCPLAPGSKHARHVR